jgi:hypothetical protein
VLARLQRGLETLYRLESGACVDDFVIDEATRDRVVQARRPREQLLVSEDAGELEIALFVDRAALDNLAANDPSRRLGDHNFGDFLLAIEGVSHFVYTMACARADRPVSQLELELQAEVDKYVTCLLVSELEASPGLRRRLFGECAYDGDLDGDELLRYRAANDNAMRYSAYLESTFVGPRRIPEMLAELRRFYRDGLAAKLTRARGYR